MKRLCILSFLLLTDVAIAQEKPVDPPPSKRLVRELKCLDNSAQCTKIQFTPDGKELLACDYPAGKITHWDVNSGEILSLFDAGFGYRGSAEYFHLSKDGKTLFADDGHQRPKITELKRDDKVMRRSEMKGAVKAWNLTTCEMLPSFQHTPPRNILHTIYAPDGLSFCTLEEPGGEFEARPPRTYSIWDVQSRETKSLPDGLMGYPTYSSDGKTLAVVIGKEDVAKEIVFLNARTLKEQRRLPLKSILATTVNLTYSSDNKWLIGKLRKKDDGEETGYWTPQIIVWNSQTGEQVFTYTGEPMTDWSYASTSPDGQYLTLTNWYPPIEDFIDQIPKERRGQLLIFDLKNKKLSHRIMLTEAVTGYSTVSVSKAVIHPHGKMIVVISRIWRFDDTAEEDKALQLIDKPVLHCIELATGKIIEHSKALVGNSCAFSPDGKLLALSTKGGIQLWDVADWSQSK